MNRKTLPLCTLLLAASLASCAPSLQGPDGTAYQPNVVVGIAYAAAIRVRADQIKSQTPGEAYATFDDCPQAAVSVIDVRKLGIGAADQVCRQARSSTDTFGVALIGVGLAAIIGFIIAFSHFGDAFKISQPQTIYKATP